MNILHSRIWAMRNISGTKKIMVWGYIFFILPTSVRTLPIELSQHYGKRAKRTAVASFFIHLFDNLSPGCILGGIRVAGAMTPVFVAGPRKQLGNIFARIEEIIWRLEWGDGSAVQAKGDAAHFFVCLLTISPFPYTSYASVLTSNAIIGNRLMHIFFKLIALLNVPRYYATTTTIPLYFQTAFSHFRFHNNTLLCTLNYFRYSNFNTVEQGGLTSYFRILCPCWLLAIYRRLLYYYFFLIYFHIRKEKNSW